MSEPARLRDAAESTVELLLLEAGAAYRGSPDARAKTLAALGLAGTAVVSVGSAGVASSLLGKLGWTKLLLLSGLSAGLVVPVGYAAWNRFHPTGMAPLSAGAPVAVKAVAAPPAPQAEAPTAAPILSVNELAVLPAKPEARTTAQGDLAAELGALDTVRGKLASGDASGALGKLDEYARTYPHGRLVLEAEVLRIDALAKNGQTGSAKKHAEAFLRRHPNSVLASRVRGYLE